MTQNKGPGLSPRGVRIVLFLALFLLTQWPFAQWASLISATAWGIPFLARYLLAVYSALIIVLISAARLDL